MRLEIYRKSYFKDKVAVLKIIQTNLILQIFYFLVIPFFTFIRLFDPLDKRITFKKSFFKKRKPLDKDINDFYNPF